MNANMYHTYVVARNCALTIQLCVYYRCIKLYNGSASLTAMEVLCIDNIVPRISCVS